MLIIGAPIASYFLKDIARGHGATSWYKVSNGWTTFLCTVEEALSMRFALISTLGLCASVLGQDAQRGSIVDDYVRKEGGVAKVGLLANIGPSGSKSAGAKPGIVVASPSTVDPNYLFTWIRDASLVFKVIIDQFTTGEDKSLRGYIDNFVHSQSVIQQISNPSGTVVTGGLGEPKFEINETAFTGSWGRPQRGLVIFTTLRMVAQTSCVSRWPCFACHVIDHLRQLADC